MDNVVEWLLDREPWVEYRTRLDLLNQPNTAKEVISAKKRTLEDPKIKALLAELTNWPGTIISSHKSAGQSFHKLAFIADLGLTKNDPGILEIIGKVMANQSDEGPFTLSTNVPKHFGGSGLDGHAWALCDAPTLVYALARFGLNEDKRVQRAIVHLTSLARDNGWPCAVSKELGNFRGPGKKEDPCPYATLIMLKTLQQFPQYKEGKEVHEGAECLLNLWSKSRELHPYIFYMGTDFRKLKVPFAWYDILHVLEVLTLFPWLAKDPRLQEMVELVRGRADKDGKYTAESIWQAWKDWDFGQKKAPSRWLTFLVLRSLKRIQ